jgi:hypothetical protein
MTPDIELMWKFLSTHETDNTAKKGLADAYQELGDEKMAYALRWCVKYKRWPRHYVKTYWNIDDWRFTSGGRRNLVFKSQGASLPEWIHQILQVNKLTLITTSVMDSIRSLGEGLWILKESLEV